MFAINASNDTISATFHETDAIIAKHIIKHLIASGWNVSVEYTAL